MRAQREKSEREKTGKKILPPELLAEIGVFAETGAVNGDFLAGGGLGAVAVPEDFLVKSHCFAPIDSRLTH